MILIMIYDDHYYYRTAVTVMVLLINFLSSVTVSRKANINTNRSSR